MLGHFTLKLKWGDTCLAISGSHLKWPSKMRGVSSFHSTGFGGHVEGGSPPGHASPHTLPFLLLLPGHPLPLCAVLCGRVTKKTMRSEEKTLEKGAGEGNLISVTHSTTNA